jgi:hypothetical protein
MVEYSVILAGIGGVIWGVRQEGRINGVERVSAEREKYADERHNDLKARLVRIEEGIDFLARNNRA